MHPMTENPSRHDGKNLQHQKLAGRARGVCDLSCQSDHHLAQPVFMQVSQADVLLSQDPFLQASSEACAQERQAMLPSARLAVCSARPAPVPHTRPTKSYARVDEQATLDSWVSLIYFADAQIAWLAAVLQVQLQRLATR